MNKPAYIKIEMDKETFEAEYIIGPMHKAEDVLDFAKKYAEHYAYAECEGCVVGVQFVAVVSKPYR